MKLFLPSRTEITGTAMGAEFDTRGEETIGPWVSEAYRAEEDEDNVPAVETQSALIPNQAMGLEFAWMETATARLPYI